MTSEEAVERIKMLSPRAGDVIVVRGVGNSTDENLYDAMAAALATSTIDPDTLVIFIGPAERIDLLGAKDMAEYGWAQIGIEAARKHAEEHPWQDGGP